MSDKEKWAKRDRERARIEEDANFWRNFAIGAGVLLFLFLIAIGLAVTLS